MTQIELEEALRKLREEANQEYSRIDGLIQEAFKAKNKEWEKITKCKTAIAQINTKVRELEAERGNVAREYNAKKQNLIISNPKPSKSKAQLTKEQAQKVRRDIAEYLRLNYKGDVKVQFRLNGDAILYDVWVLKEE